MLTVKANGIKLAYERRGKGKALVLIHGYPLNHTIWAPVLPKLEGVFDVIAPDLRGFGSSEKTPPGYSMLDLAEDIAGLLEMLGIRKAAVVGHSMGGYVALSFAHAHPEQVTGLGLVASQAVADTPEKAASREEEARKVLVQGVSDVAAGMAGKMSADTSLQSKLKALIAKQRPEGVAGALLAMAGRPDASAFLGAFDFPVTAIHGTADALIPIERARAVIAAVKHGMLYEVEGAGHMPMMEAPEATARALKNLG